MFSHQIVPPPDQGLCPSRLPLVDVLVTEVEAYGPGVQPFSRRSPDNPGDEHIGCVGTACGDVDLELDVPVFDAEGADFLEEVRRHLVGHQVNPQMTVRVRATGSEGEVEGFLGSCSGESAPLELHPGASRSASGDAELRCRVVERHRGQHGGSEAHPFIPFHIH